MNPKVKPVTSVLIAAFCLSGLAAIAEDQPKALAPVAATQTVSSTAVPTPAAAARQWQAESPDYSDIKPKRKHPMVNMIKGLGKEIDYRLDETAKDMVFVFSAQDSDPYDQQEPPPRDQPYECTKIKFTDGKVATVVKFPDGSERVIGGRADGTLLLPIANGEFAVKYPNGDKGKLVRTADGEFRVYRPDNSLTTFKKEVSGKYSICNNQLGVKGECVPDDSGSNFELH